jgi:pimeloyl-ACP methyl ester carboxylesterase
MLKSESEKRVRLPSGLDTFYFDYSGGNPPILLLHGLSANASEFRGLVDAGLAPAHRVIAPDLRGRARSGKPKSGYTMEDHARDVLALMNNLGLDEVVLGGHSFGGLLSIYMASRYPEKISKVIVIDAAIEVHPDVRDMLRASLGRLERTLPSSAEYLSQLQSAPYVNGMWDEYMEGYYRAEIRENPDGTAQSMTSSDAIAQALDGAQAEDWELLVRNVHQPVLLFNATEGYGPPGSPALVPPELAKKTAAAFSSCRYVPIAANHLTMVFGANAARLTTGILDFLQGEGR